MNGRPFMNRDSFVMPDLQNSFERLTVLMLSFKQAIASG